MRTASHRELTRCARVADPSGLPLSRTGGFHADASLPWAEGRDLVSDTPVFVPFELVHTDFTVPRAAGSGFFVPSTNGLGAGNAAPEAWLHGLCELVERDAETVWRHAGEEHRRASRVAIETVDGPRAADLVALFRRAGLETMIWDLTSDLRVACFRAVIFDLESDPDLNLRPAAEGSGCHPDRDVALYRALAEAAQSRLTTIAGSRDDLSMATYEAFQSRASLDHWRAEVPAPAPRSFADVPHAAGERTIAGDLAYVVDHLAERGIEEIVTVDLGGRQVVDLAFSRVVVAGLEGSMSSPSYTPGPRARARLGGHS